MNKWQIICPVVALLLTALVFGSIHMRGERRYLISAVTQQIDGHAPQIGGLLTAMRGSNVTVVEDAAFQELQAIPSTSLISRSMIRVAPAGDGGLECVVDTDAEPAGAGNSRRALQFQWSERFAAPGLRLGTGSSGCA
jgi:hypothetical protein